MSGKKGAREKRKKLVQGDDAIESFEYDWLDFETPAIELAKQLYTISQSSGVCCGIIGSWGSGKSSFMKLMNEYIRRKSSWKNVHTAWFTAWDPGGIQDLGDAMLYHFFHCIVEESKEMAEVFEELQEALGIRRSLRERTSRVLQSVSPVLPVPGQVAATVASTLLRDFDAPRKVQTSFEKLMNWLEKENQIVFLFVDDIDRASGDQIRDLLSELKLYISHRRIAAVLGYDEDYVLAALKPVLPSGIDSKKYLEKIVTIRTYVPMAAANMRAYAEHLLLSVLDSPLGNLPALAAKLSFNNPRRLKNLVLAFTHSISPPPKRKIFPGNLDSILVVCAASNMGFLADDAIRSTIEEGNEGAIVSAIEDFVRKDPSKSEDAGALIEAIRIIEPDFAPRCISDLRLPGALPYPLEEKERREEIGFDWRVSLIPILSSAAMRGFKLAPGLVKSSGEMIDVPPSTKAQQLKSKEKEPPAVIKELFRDVPRCPLLSWNKTDMIVLASSYMVEEPLPAPYFVDKFLDHAADFVAEKAFVLWIVDDMDLFPQSETERRVTRAREVSKGLKHPFIFQYTPYSEIASLLKFLMGEN